MEIIGYEEFRRRLKALVDEGNITARTWWERYIEPPSGELLARACWTASPQKVPAAFSATTSFWILLVELVRTSLDATDGGTHSLPPVTTALATLNVAAYLKPGGWYMRNVALSPYMVVGQRQLYRLAGCALVHVNAEHLLSNMVGLLGYGSRLEQRQGSGKFAGTVVMLTFAAHGMVVAAAALAHKLGLGSQGYYYATGSVGFSAIAFGLQVLDGYARGGEVAAFGCRAPAKYGCWINFAAASALVPGASMPGHAAGIAAGLMMVFVPKAVYDIARILRLDSGYRGGRITGGRISEASSSSPRGQQEHGNPLRSAWRSSGVCWSDLMVHAACAGLAVVSALLTRRLVQSTSMPWR